MYIDNINKAVVIKDRFIYEFMKTNGSEEFLNVCESMIKSICLTCSHNFKKDDFQVELFINRLNTFKSEFIESVNKQKIDISEVKELFNNNSLKLDNIKDSINTGNKIEVFQAIERVSEKLDAQVLFKSSNRAIGEVGEAGLINVLENCLTLREGYEIVETKAIPHNCDILIKKLGFPDIRVESKAHGGKTGEPVRTKEVKRFESDIIGLNNHGIFVSLYSDICGKGQVEIDLLHTNKFAVYLSNNNFDGHIIKDFVGLIYKLERVITNLNTDNSFKITTESMNSVKTYLTDFANKITILKTSMKSNIAILNEISFDIIEKILLGNNTQRLIANSDNVFSCEVCKTVCKTSKGLSIHKKNCEKKNRVL